METKLSPYQREAIRNGRTPLPRARGEWPVGVRKRPRCGKSGDPKVCADTMCVSQAQNETDYNGKISRTESPSKCKKSASKTKELIAQPSLGDKGNKQEAEQPVGM